MPKKSTTRRKGGVDSEPAKEEGLDTNARLGISEGVVDPMEPLENQRHEAFAQEMAKGSDSLSAYLRIYPDASRESAESAGPRLFGKVRERVKELQRCSATSTTLTMQERREFLARAVRAKLHEIDLNKDGDLIQEIQDSENGRKIKLPGKRECIMADAELAGELIEKHEIKDTTPREPLDVLRERVRKARQLHARA